MGEKRYPGSWKAVDALTREHAFPSDSKAPFGYGYWQPLLNKSELLPAEK
jgi:hypothetical protein